MTRKHFILLANMLKAMPAARRLEFAPAVVLLCEESNPRFDRVRFARAAGLPTPRQARDMQCG